MKNLHNLLIGLLTAITSSLIVIGGVSLALAEGLTPTLVPTQPAPELMMPTFVPLVLQSNAQILPIFTTTPTTSATDTIVMPTACPPPKGWQAYTIQIGDTLPALANRSGISKNKLSQANCLLIDTLLPDTILYVPPTPTPKPTATKTLIPIPSLTSIRIPCGPPPGWVRYIVRPSDTLYKLSLSVGASVYQLQSANCLGNSQFIMAGETLFVPHLPYIPYVPPATPTFTATPQPTVIQNTSTSTKIATQAPTKTKVPTDTKIPTAATPPTEAPTDTALPTSPPTDVSPPTVEPTAS
jgi:LysM repeat protein